MELDDRKSSYHNFLYDLPNGVEQANTAIVASPLWKEDDYHPSHLCWDVAPVPDCLQQGHKHPPAVAYPLHPVLRFFTLHVP